MDNTLEKAADHREVPNLEFDCHQIPTKRGDINWDVVSEDYHSYILGPFAPEMVSENSEGKRRNLLLNYLHNIPKDVLKRLEIADFGCGPGNLIPFVAGMVQKITGIDSSISALSIASNLAKEYDIEFQ